MTRTPDFLPEVESVDRVMRDLERLGVERWGDGELVLTWAPSWRASELHRRLAPTVERACASPGMVRAIIEAARHLDVRAALPAITVPTLILHRRDEWIPIEAGRDLAERVPGARLVELAGDDHLFFAGDWKSIVSEIEAFLTGKRRTPSTDRLLQTVLFTDIVRSTERVAELGDERWRELLWEHDRIMHDELSRFGGRPVKNLGDGFLATFDGPTRAVRCAQAICEEVRELRLEVRAGIHTGECEVVNEDLTGLAVHIGARVGSLARPSEVLVSGTVCDLVVGSGIGFVDRGTHELRGVPGRWHLYAVATDQPKDARAVQHVDHEAAALTPGPRATMRPLDRATVALAKQAPGMMRTAFRMVASLSCCNFAAARVPGGGQSMRRSPPRESSVRGPRIAFG